jgi:PPM family protein phosphatase
MIIRWEAAGASDVGRRRRGNEDAFHLDPERGIFIVADGMGGHAAGEIASGVAVRTANRILADAVDRQLPQPELSDRIAGAFQEARDELERCCNDDPATHGMGTTLTACVVAHDGDVHIGHIGDSRAYLFRDDQVQLLTVDHTWVQREVDEGRLLADSAESHPLSHILTRVLSSDLPADPDIVTGRVRPGDLLLLTSDGLHGLVPYPELRQIATSGAPLPEMLSRFVDSANRHGGRDNITGVVVRFLPHDAPTF